MKKLFLFLCVALILSVTAAACSDGARSDVSMAELYEEIKAAADLPDMIELDSAQRLDRNYGITEDMTDDFAGGIDSSGVTMTEIVLIKAKDKRSADEIAEKLDHRLKSKLDQNRTYNPAQAAIIEKCRVEQKGLYVTMIIAEEADLLTGIVNKHLQ